MIMLLFFYMVLIVAVRNMVSEAYLTAIFLVPILFFLICTYKKICKINRSIVYKEWIIKHRKLIWAILQILSTMVMIGFCIKLRVNISWDWGQLLRTSSTYVLSGEWDKLEYYARCSNNQPWLYCLIMFFRMILFFCPNANEMFLQSATIYLSICFTQITLLLIYKIGREIYEDEFKALILGVCSLCALPFYLYAQFAYTDTISMMLATLAIFLYLRLKHTSNVIVWKIEFIILTVVSALIFKIKVLAFIVIIALLIDSFLRCTNLKKYVIILFASIIFFIGVNKTFTIFIRNEIPITDEMLYEKEMSWTHYLMMGMNHYGGYSEEDVSLTYNAGNYEEKQLVNLQELKKRIENYGFKGTLNHLFYTKLTRTWGNSLLAGDDYSHRQPYYPGSIAQRIFGYGEDLHWGVLVYSWFYHFCMLFGIWIEIIFSHKRDIKEQNFLLFRYTVFGVGIFLSVWECNSRYLLPFFPVMISLAFEGWNIFIPWCMRKQKLFAENKR